MTVYVHERDQATNSEQFGGFGVPWRICTFRVGWNRMLVALRKYKRAS